MVPAWYRLGQWGGSVLCERIHTLMTGLAQMHAETVPAESPAVGDSGRLKAWRFGVIPTLQLPS